MRKTESKHIKYSKCFRNEKIKNELTDHIIFLLQKFLNIKCLLCEYEISHSFCESIKTIYPKLKCILYNKCEKCEGKGQINYSRLYGGDCTGAYFPAVMCEFSDCIGSGHYFSKCVQMIST